MRIVAVADTHLFTDELRVPDGDLFLHAGDLCRGGTLAELALAAAWIQSLPHRHKVVVAGNHDWSFVRQPDEARALLDGIVYLEDAEATIDGVRIYGSPWQPEFNDWAFNLPRGKPLVEKWARIPQGLDVLVTHGPPRGIGDATAPNAPDGRMMGREGCADLRARVEVVRPRLHLFGHIHQDGGVWTVGATTFANVTCWECERPPTVIDVDHDAVRLVSVPPRRARRA